MWGHRRGGQGSRVGEWVGGGSDLLTMRLSSRSNNDLGAQLTTLPPWLLMLQAIACAHATMSRGDHYTMLTARDRVPVDSLT